ncbi:hypothetical protein F5B20DRAFT_350572 [Whalleya microplaca]|nr:hypothetical protein F5B20DRAFT_350572 [Whalleya microplaca]
MMASKATYIPGYLLPQHGPLWRTTVRAASFRRPFNADIGQVLVRYASKTTASKPTTTKTASSKSAATKVAAPKTASTKSPAAKAAQASAPTKPIAKASTSKPAATRATPTKSWASPATVKPAAAPKPAAPTKSWGSPATAKSTAVPKPASPTPAAPSKSWASPATVKPTAAPKPEAPTPAAPASAPRPVLDAKPAPGTPTPAPKPAAAPEPVDPSKPIVLEKPERFNPPSHGARLPRSLPKHYGGPMTTEEVKAQRTHSYPGLPPPENTWSHWFINNRGIHMFITLGTLTSLTIYTFASRFNETSPYADLIPPTSEFYRHPFQYIGVCIDVLKMHEEHISAETAEKRRRKVDDVAKRKEYRKAHGIEPPRGFWTSAPEEEAVEPVTSAEPSEPHPDPAEESSPDGKRKKFLGIF